MGVPKHRTSKARRDRRRVHDQLRPAATVKCSQCGADKLPHCVCSECGAR